MPDTRIKFLQTPSLPKTPLGDQSGSGLTEEAKQALLDCFENAAWVGSEGQDYYDALYDALYPTAKLTSIAAAFAQGNSVFLDTDSVDNLKQNLTVTAFYDNGTSKAVTSYNLSGQMVAGTQTFTVTYIGKTATFTAAIKHNYAEVDFTKWTKANYQTIVLEQNQIKLVCANQSQVTGYNAWVADCKKTLWSAVEGKTVKVRVKVSGENFVSGTDYLLFMFGLYADSSVTSLGSSYAKRGGGFSVVPQNDGVWYEGTFVCEISNFTTGDITPTSQSTFGLLCYSQSLKNAYITDVQMFEVDAE